MVRTQNDVTNLVQELLTKHQEDREAAMEDAVGIILSNPGPWESLIRPLLVTAITTIVNNIAAGRRSALKRAATKLDQEPEFEFETESSACCYAGPRFVETLPRGVDGNTLSKQNPEVISKAVILRFLDKWQLNRVKKHLGDATKEDLEIEIDMFRNLAKGNDQVREFLTKLYDKLEPGQMVREVFTNMEIANLFNKTRKEMNTKWAEFRNPLQKADVEELQPTVLD
jgi:hypothetical protein